MAKNLLTRSKSDLFITGKIHRRQAIQIGRKGYSNWFWKYHFNYLTFAMA